MNSAEVAWQRFSQQGLLDAKFDNPVDVVTTLGAVQSQDYAGAKWALAQRTRGLVTDAEMDSLFNSGAILRTHVMRPTWHFVTPADIRWMLKLTAPHVHAATAYYYRKFDLDDHVFRQGHQVLQSALEGGNHLTRAELTEKLIAAGITGDNLRHSHILMHAELEALICSGPRRGKQFTYALVDERVPPAPELDPDQALVELTLRYFLTHGPAQLKDFTWWSGLTAAQAKKGINLAGSALVQDTFNGQSCWASATQQSGTWASPTSHLLPNYDEALASFKDYSAATDPQLTTRETGDAMFLGHFLVIDGHIVGAWRRTLTKQSVRIETQLFRPLSDVESHSLIAAANRYAEFLGLIPELDLSPTAIAG